jgi:hypothetical protein
MMPIVGVAIGAKAARLLEQPATYLGAAMLGGAALLVLVVGAALKRLLPRHLEPVCACALAIAAVAALAQT